MAKKNKNLIKFRLMVMLIITIIVGVNFFPTTNRYCSKNPDKCVCEEEIKGCSGGYTVDLNTGKSWCHQDYIECKDNKLRKKTQAELIEQNCLRNPREDNDCTCIEYFHCIKEVETYINHDAYFVVTNSSGIEYSDNKGKSTFFEKPPDSEICDNFGFVLRYNFSLKNKKEMYVHDENDTDFCDKARAKTECEKENTNWVEEGKNIIINTSKTGHRECQLKTGWFCPFSDGLKLVDNKTNYVACEYHKNVCVSTSSVCREKTDIEKECNNLFNQINQCKQKNYPLIYIFRLNYYYNIHCEDLKQAWRQKGCTI